VGASWHISSMFYGSSSSAAHLPGDRKLVGGSDFVAGEGRDREDEDGEDEDGVNEDVVVDKDRVD